MGKVWNFVQEYSLLLIAGAIIALLWANTSPESYHHFVDFELVKDSFIGALHTDADGHVSRSITLHWLVNDLLMAFFFALAGKEVWEAVALKRGSLRGKKALTPLIATAGGMLGPVSVYLLGAFMVGKMAVLANGWAIPTATDIAFSYLVGRMVFGAGHPAVGFLLLLAIADDAIGLIILAVFYPQGELAPIWLLLSVAAGVGVYLVANWLPRRMDRGNQDRPMSTFFRKTVSIWPYVIAGALSWYGFYKAGIHPALGLLPIVPAIPHADVDYGIFADAEKHLTDMLNHIEHILKRPVEVILLGFGLMNAGVEFSSIGDATWLVLAGLLIGKPFGILLFGYIGARVMGFGLPVGMKISDLFVLGCVAAIGFTVSLFVAAVAFEAGPIQDAAKMGALLSFGAAGLALIMGKIFKSSELETAQPAE